MKAITSAAPAKLNASRPKGMAMASPNISPPIGGPARSFIASSVDPSRPAARSRSPTSTVAGTIAMLELSTTASADANSAATTKSIPIDTWSSRMTATRPAITTARAMSRRIRSTRRSYRSAHAPPGRMNSNQGSRSATVTPAIRRGSSVTDVASSGSATRRRPSPRFDSAVAPHSSRKFRGSGEPSRERRPPRPSAGGRRTDGRSDADERRPLELARVDAERLECRVDLVQRSWRHCRAVARVGIRTHGV